MIIPETRPRSRLRRATDPIRRLWGELLYRLHFKRRPFTSFIMPNVRQPFPERKIEPFDVPTHRDRG